MTSTICSRISTSPCPLPYCSASGPRSRSSRAVMSARKSIGSPEMFGMPPARETTSGRLATANSARISEERIPWARSAYESNHGSSRVPPPPRSPAGVGGSAFVMWGGLLLAHSRGCRLRLGVACRLGRSGNERRQLRSEGRLRPRADERRHELAPAEEGEGRDGDDAVVPGRVRVLVDVEPDDAQPLPEVGGELGEHGRELEAGLAPRRPEVDEHRPGGLEDLGGEGVVSDLRQTRRRHRATAPCGVWEAAASGSAASPRVARYRSASSAAAQPVPAAVMACR